MILVQNNGKQFAHRFRMQFPSRKSSVVVHSSTSPPQVSQKAATPAQIVEYNGQKAVAKVTTDGSVEEASGQDLEGHATIVGRAKEAASDLFLPTGYPDTLTPDYLEYQLWALPVHVTGWLANSLATSSMLKAAGIGSSAAGAVAAGAAIKWITKDGIGALGRVLVGGGLARFFDEDPRFWRFWADVVKCFGQALEVATPLYPDMFILLAGAGNLTKAAGRGISRPAFRVIQQHFATGGNVGDVAAREEVWEVAGQLMGLALSVAILQGLDSDGIESTLLVSPAVAVIVLWLVTQLSHIALRYKSLSVLQLPWISQARATTLAHAFVRGDPLPSVQELSMQESFATPKQFLHPRISTNATLKDLESAADRLPFSSSTARSSSNGASESGGEAEVDVKIDEGDTVQSSGGTLNGNGSVNGSAPSRVQQSGDCRSPLQHAMDLYSAEDYILLPCDAQGKEFVMGVKADCAEHSMSKAQAVLQAVWYSEHREEHKTGEAGDVDALIGSLQYVNENRSQFESKLIARGWDTERILMCSQSKAILRMSR